MAILDAIKAAWDIFTGGSETEHFDKWAQDETSFEDHFGVPYHEYAEVVNRLSRADFELYEKTLKTNPEAAVIWVIFRSDGQ